MTKSRGSEKILTPELQDPCKYTYKLPKECKKRVIKNEAKLDKKAGEKKGDFHNWGADFYEIPTAWVESKGEGARVAILDTGIDLTHPDLEPAILKTKDFTGEGIEDKDGHGTHCAGVVAGRQNGLGMVGIAPQCMLLIAKVLAKGEGTDERVADGIYWAVKEGADIISMSFGGVYMSPCIYRAIQYALYEGKSVICAAGNRGIGHGNTIDYPGKNGGVITVGSHDRNGNPSGFSSRGGELDFMGPGSDIWSTYKGGKYAMISGTSMATPFVAGLAALVVSKHKQPGEHKTPVRNCEDLKNHLLVMASHPHQHDSQTGYGSLLPFRYFRGQ